MDGSITGSVTLSSEPSSLAVSDDGQFLYVGLKASSSVVRLVLPALTSDITISLGSGPLGAYYAMDLEVSPQAPHTVGIIRGQSGASGNNSLVIYDDATARPNTSSATNSSDAAQWTADSSTIFAVNHDSSDEDLQEFAVDSNGVTLQADYDRAFPTPAGRIHYDFGTAIIYGDGGNTMIPATGVPAGHFNSLGVMTPDGALDAAFFVEQETDGSYNLVTFDLAQFTPVAYLPLASFTGLAERVLRWGSNGLAIGTPAGVYFVNGNIVNLPSAIQPSYTRTLTLPVITSW
jgi:hypothetical protein